MEKTFFYHCSSKDKGLKEGHRISTVAAVQVGSALHFGIAQVSPCDNFTKYIGRDKATGRAKSKSIKVVEIAEGQKSGEVFVKHAKEIAESDITKILYPSK